MRLPMVRLASRWMAVAGAVLVASGLILNVVGFSFKLGQAPEVGWTFYPTLAVAQWVDSGGPIPPEKLPPRQSREVVLGTLVTWADGTRTLYIHR